MDILINSAGTSVYKPFLEITEADFDMVIDTNLKATCFIMQAALLSMLPRKQGVIINITSVAGLIGFVNQQIYNASKGGLVFLTRSLAKELGPQGIRLVSVAPGVIESPMTDKWASSAPDPEAFRRSREEGISSETLWPARRGCCDRCNFSIESVRLGYGMFLVD